MVSTETVIAIIAPSRTMNITWSLANLPPNPWLSSATRKEHRTRIAIVAMAIAEEIVSQYHEGGVDPEIAYHKETDEIEPSSEELYCCG